MVIFLHLMLVAVGTGFLSSLIHFCLGDPSGEFKEGRIFSWIGRQLLDRYEYVQARHEALRLQSAAYGREPRTYLNWWKLGVCPICYNVWLTAAAQVFAVIAMGYKAEALFWLPVAMGFSFYALLKSR